MHFHCGVTCTSKDELFLLVKRVLSFIVMADNFFFSPEVICGASSKYSVNVIHSTVVHIFQVYWEIGFNNDQCVESQENT